MTDIDMSGVQGSGVWFDGMTTTRREVHLLLIDDVLRIALVPTPSAIDLPTSTGTNSDAPVEPPPRAMPTRCRVSSLLIAEPTTHAPLALQLPDGTSLWVDDPSAPLAQALMHVVAQPQGATSWFSKMPRAARLIASWPAAVACLIASIALVVWFDRQGAALVARAALVVLPERLDNTLGDAVYASIEDQWLEPSTMSIERQSVLQARFASVAQTTAPDRTVALHFHRMRDRVRSNGSHSCPVGREDETEATSPTSPTDPVTPSSVVDSTPEPVASPSTMASTPDPKADPARMPSVEASAGDTKTREPDGGFNAFALPNGTIVILDGMSSALSDDEIMAVLGHELGHVVHRHSMQSVARSIGLLTVAGVVLGDFSSVIASAVATLQTFRYSRDAEREADAYGHTFARSARLPLGTEAAVWQKLLDEQRSAGADALPEWISTHPPTQERLDAARKH